MKSAEEVAKEEHEKLLKCFTDSWIAVTPWLYNVTHAALVAAIEADRAQLEAEYAYQVVTGGTSRYPLAIVGAYRSEFEAKAVAKEWNRINNRYGIRYRVEVDS